MKYLILGAGPAGLTFANYLKQHGENSFYVLEKNERAGGLCRDEIIDNAPVDIGGGHFLDFRNPMVVQFLFQFMPENEWNRFVRNSQIVINNAAINSPIEANIWQMEVEYQVEYLKSIAIAGCNLNIPKPEKFIEWIYWKLGEKIAKEYMIPYNTKMFSKDLNELGTYWLDKLPNVSFEQTLLSCLERKAYGTQPGHTEFFYPKKYGYGEVWLRMAENIKGNIEYNVDLTQFDFTKNEVNASYKADYIISTIPWKEFDILYGMPDILQQKIQKLKHTSIQIEYLNEDLNTDAQWIYYPSLELSYHRTLVRHNFYKSAIGYWTETNLERVKHKSNFSYINHYAYPLNTIEKPSIMAELLEWSRKQYVYGLGRWGEHQHYNSDVTVEKAIELAKKLIN
jgi:protoporphyrinogen oxidase